MFALFTLLGLQHVMYATWQTYGRVMLELLSTVEVHEREEHHSIPESMTFRLDNENRQLTVEDLADILHVPQGGYIRDMSKSVTNDFWDAMVDDEAPRGYNNVRNKASNIRNPVFFYVQKVLASSLLARHELGNVRLIDAWIITCML